MSYDLLKGQDIKTEGVESGKTWLTDHEDILNDILKDEDDFVSEVSVEMSELHEGIRSVSNDWLADDTVPEGWMIR